MDALAKSADNLASWFLAVGSCGPSIFSNFMIRFKLSSWLIKPQEIPPLQNGGASSRLLVVF